ncbi:MAG: TonB family protein [Candidatus Omnitrophica bacterium]|nr:TonB family protein [Candidatus Omnitrophota bacterium]
MTKRILQSFIVSGFAILCCFGVLGAADKSGEEFVMYVGDTRPISASNPTRIVISNPQVIDVVEVSKDTIIVAAKGRGTTTLFYWDASGEKSQEIRVYTEDMKDIKRRIDSMLETLDLPEVYTKDSDEEGKVMLLGRVKSDDDIKKISLALGPLMAKTINLTTVREEESVVEIDVQVLELDQDASKTLGVTWPSSVSLTEVGSPGLAAGGTAFSNVFRLLNVKRDSAFTLKLDALIEEGKAKILSRPRLACQSGKEAELLVGGEKPVLTTSVAATAGSSGTEVEYKEFGIKLKMKPTVMPDDRIKLGVKMEVSDYGEAETLGTATNITAKAFPLTKRNASTELFLLNGQTLSIGGLMRRKTEEQVTKVPWFGDLPLVGGAFRKRVTKTGGGTGQKADTELYIIITPTIVSRETPYLEKKTEEQPADAEKPQQPLTPDAKQMDISMEQAKKAASTVEVADEYALDPVAKYTGIIKQKIMKNLAYPAQAKQSGFEGTVQLSLLISYKGDLLDAVVKNSSNYKILDDNALKVAKQISQYPPFPTTIGTKELWVDIPISYQLE